MSEATAQCQNNSATSLGRGGGEAGHIQPDRQEAYIVGHTGVWSYRGHRQPVRWGHTLEHCQLYIEKAHTTSQTGGTQWSPVNYTFRGHRQPVGQSNLGSVYMKMLKVKCSFGP